MNLQSHLPSDNLHHLLLQNRNHHDLQFIDENDKNLEEFEMSDRDRIENELKTNWKQIENK